MGGAIALGHPLGATGAIRAATVVHALRRHNLKYGMVTMCVGTGMGAAGIFERVCERRDPTDRRDAHGRFAGHRACGPFLHSADVRGDDMDILIQQRRRRADHRVQPPRARRTRSRRRCTRRWPTRCVDAARRRRRARHPDSRQARSIFTAGNDLEDFMKTPPIGPADAPGVPVPARASASAREAGGGGGGGRGGRHRHDDAAALRPGLRGRHREVLAAVRATRPVPGSGVEPAVAARGRLPARRRRNCCSAKHSMPPRRMRMGLVNRRAAARPKSTRSRLRRPRKLAALPASSLRVTKRLMKRAEPSANCRRRWPKKPCTSARCCSRRKRREAFKAFFEKRKPDFRQFD